MQTQLWTSRDGRTDVWSLALTTMPKQRLQMRLVPQHFQKSWHAQTYDRAFTAKIKLEKSEDQNKDNESPLITDKLKFRPHMYQY